MNNETRGYVITTEKFFLCNVNLHCICNVNLHCRNNIIIPKYGTVVKISAIGKGLFGYR